MTQKLKSAFFTSLRAVIGIGIAAFLVSRTMQKADMGPADLMAQIVAANPLLLILAFLLHGTILALTALRWRLLLNAQGIPATWLETLRLTLIGFFFNLAVPGAVGGDLAKVGYLAKGKRGQATEAIFSIVVDRIMGVLGLFTVAAVCVLLSLPALRALPPESAFVRSAAIVVGLGSVAGVLGLIALEFHDRFIRFPGLRALWPFLARYSPRRIVETVTRLVAAVDMYRRKKGTIAVAILLSICVHTTLALDLYTVGKAMGESKVRLREYFLTTQVSNAIASIPVTPGGVGLRDRSNQEFLGAFGMDIEMAAMVPITMTLIILGWAMVGLIVFIASPASRGPKLDESEKPPQLPLTPCE